MCVKWTGAPESPGGVQLLESMTECEGQSERVQSVFSELRRCGERNKQTVYNNVKGKTRRRVNKEDERGDDNDHTAHGG